MGGWLGRLAARYRMRGWMSSQKGQGWTVTLPPTLAANVRSYFVKGSMPWRFFLAGT